MNNYKHFSNKECEYYPCHNIEEQNCIFCFCPLFNDDCGGDYVLLDKVKDCSSCSRPHNPEGYEDVVKQLRDVDSSSNIHNIMSNYVLNIKPFLLSRLRKIVL